MGVILAGVPLYLWGAPEASPWVFEGLVTEADPRLAPDLQSGWVLAGSFSYTPLLMEEVVVESTGRSGRLAGGIAEGELTIDLYYQLHFSATQTTGMAGYDYQDDDPEKDGRDLLGWFIPMKGRLKESEWTSSWLQVWLADPAGELIRTVPPTVSPYGIKWKHGWFRLTFVNGDGATAYVDGRMEYFGPEGEDNRDDSDKWREIVDQLGGILAERDATIASLETELATVRDRVDGLRKMVDLLVQERRNLQEENTLLQEKAGAADPEVESAMTELTLQKSLLEEELDTLTSRNRELADSLAASEVERRKLVLQLEELETAVQSTPGPVEEKTSGTAAVFFDGKPVGTMTIVAEPVVIEPATPPVTAAADAPRKPAQPVALPAPAPKPLDKSEPTLSRRRGPRKFR